MGDHLHRVAVVGSRDCGKSSLIKRIVSHRFDNLPTQNEEFMGRRSDGRHVMAMTVPVVFTTSSGKAAGPSQVLLEMQDQLDDAPDVLLEEPLWYETLGFDSSVRREPASPFGGGMKKEAVIDDGELDAAQTEAWNSTAQRLRSQLPRADMKACRDAVIKADGNFKMARQALQAVLAAQDKLSAEADRPKANSTLPEQPGPHPLRAPVIANAAREVGTATMDDEGGMINPVLVPHGTHGWVVLFDLSSPTSFFEASRLVQRLLSRVGFDRLRRTPCPIVIVLVGNKCDKSSGRRSPVSHRMICELLERGVLSGALVGQLRRQKADQALRKLCDAIAEHHKTSEAATSLAGKGKARSVSVSFANTPQQSNGPGAMGAISTDPRGVGAAPADAGR